MGYYSCYINFELAVNITREVGKGVVYETLVLYVSNPTQGIALKECIELHYHECILLVF
jgi:hypothetical protein